MRVFVFFLMMAVSLAGVLGGYRAITGRDLVSLSDFGVGHVTASAALQPTPLPSTSTPVAAARPQPTLAPTAAATPTPGPGSTRVMLVANTGGQGVYLRKTPKLDDKLRAWVEGTKFEVSGSPVEADGTTWLRAKAPDGAEGFIPSLYLVPQH